jgi:hypothetical protein
MPLEGGLKISSSSKQVQEDRDRVLRAKVRARTVLANVRSSEVVGGLARDDLGGA